MTDLAMPCFNCGKPVRQGVKFCDIVCATEWEQKREPVS